MIRKRPIANTRRRAAASRTQGLLEVKVRAQLVRRQRNHTLLLWVCKAGLALAMVGGGIYGAREIVNRMFLQNPGYNLAAVEIHDDGPALSRELILETARLQLGENIFSFRLTRAHDALAALPQVERVELQRVLPNRIVVDITERRPVAWLADPKASDPSASEKSFLIDGKGVLFKPKRQLPEYLRLPAIYGAPIENYLPADTVDTPEVGAALELIQKNGDLSRFRLQSVDISKGYCIVATDGRRAKLTFGLEEVDRQLERFGAILDEAARRGKEVRSVNLMVEHNIPVVWVDQGSEPAPPSSPVAAALAASRPTPKPTPKAVHGPSTKPSAHLAALATPHPAPKPKSTPKPASTKVSVAVPVRPAASEGNAPQWLEIFRRKNAAQEPTVRRAEPVR